MPRRWLRRLALALAMSLVYQAGCGPSGAVTEVPDAARKALIQRKVDVTPRSTKSSRPGQSGPRNQGAR
jgi:hypothetical protein